MKKTILLTLALCFGIGTAFALPKETCKCNRGDMTVTIEGGKIQMSCSEGGTAVCSIE